MEVLIIVPLAFITANLQIALAIKVHERFDDRIQAMLRSVYWDIGILFGLSLLVSTQLLALFLIFKYIVYSFVDFEQTMDDQ